MTFRYRQSTGEWFGPDGRLWATGWSGHTDGRNNPLMQSRHGIGPLPVGIYIIGDPVDPPDHLGLLAMPLTPDATNEMFGRGDFYIHGANPVYPELSSDGCIVLGKSVRQRICDAPEDRLEVVE